MGVQWGGAVIKNLGPQDSGDSAQAGSASVSQAEALTRWRMHVVAPPTLVAVQAPPALLAVALPGLLARPVEAAGVARTLVAALALPALLAHTLPRSPAGAVVLAAASRTDG